MFEPAEYGCRKSMKNSFVMGNCENDVEKGPWVAKEFLHFRIGIVGGTSEMEDEGFPFVQDMQ